MKQSIETMTGALEAKDEVISMRESEVDRLRSLLRRRRGSNAVVSGVQGSQKPTADTNMDDIEALLTAEDDGVAGAVIGRAIYEGTLDFTAARELVNARKQNASGA